MFATTKRFRTFWAVRRGRFTQRKQSRKKAHGLGSSVVFGETRPHLRGHKLSAAAERWARKFAQLQLQRRPHLVQERDVSQGVGDPAKVVADNR